MGSAQKPKSNVSPEIVDDSPFTPNDNNRDLLASTQTTPNILVGLGISNAVPRTRCEVHMDSQFRHAHLTSELQVIHNSLI
jgi:hypothetical protein